MSPPGGREQPLKRVGGRAAPGPVHSMVAAVMWNDKPGPKAFGIMVQPVMSTARCTNDYWVAPSQYAHIERVDSRLVFL